MISARRFVVLLAGYFVLQILLRLVASRLADLDESEQLVFSQSFQWGYGAQPPLYTWLQILLFKVFGPTILALALLKNVLLFGFYAFTYGAARLVTRTHVGGVLATVGLLFLPQFAWESQRDLTHSVLASTSSAATLFVFLKWRETASRGFYVLFGFVSGIGVLSNHTYWIFLAGLIMAGPCLKEFRPLLANRCMLLSCGIAALVIMPYAMWVADHSSIVVSTSRKFHIQDNAPFVITALHALGSLAVSWISHVVGVVLIFGVLCWKQLVPFPRDVLRRPAVRLILLLLYIALTGVAVSMLLTHATSFKGRWLQPLFFCVPILCAAVVQPRIDRFAIRRVLAAASAVAVSVIILIPGRVWSADQLHRKEQLNAPYATLFSQLGPEINTADIIVADTHVVAGNLRLLFPDKSVFTPRFVPSSARAGDRVLVLFNATFNDAVPPELQRILRSLGKPLRPEQMRFVEAPWSGQTASLRLGAAWVD